MNWHYLRYNFRHLCMWSSVDVDFSKNTQLWHFGGTFSNFKICFYFYFGFSVLESCIIARRFLHPPISHFTFCKDIKYTCYKWEEVILNFRFVCFVLNKKRRQHWESVMKDERRVKRMEKLDCGKKHNSIVADSDKETNTLQENRNKSYKNVWKKTYSTLFFRLFVLQCF